VRISNIADLTIM